MVVRMADHIKNDYFFNRLESKLGGLYFKRLLTLIYNHQKYNRFCLWAHRKIAFSPDYGVAAKIKNAHIPCVCCAFWFSRFLS